MSNPLLVYYVLAKMMSAIESAPLGNGISDPLVSSVELPDGDNLSNILTIFRRDIPPEEMMNTGKYEGYIFNQKRCIQFNNRILCGYDKNKGTQLDDYTMIDIGSGCRARGDRIECGYDNPPRIITNLRLPDFKHEEHRAHDAPHEEYRAHHAPHEEHRAYDAPHGELDAPNGKHDVPHGAQHDAPHREHDVPNHKHHHHRHHRLEDKHDNGLARLAPTRTAMTTDPTVPYTILESVESDYLEIELLKSAFDKLLLKGEDTKIKSVKLATASIKPINLATDAVKPVTTTTIKPIKHKPTLTTKINIISKSSKATNTTSTTEKKTTVADSQMIKRMIKLAPRKEPKRRQLKSETSSDSPQLISTDNSKSDTTTTTVSPISKPYKKRNEKKLETACVEQGDRIVCYDFKKS